MTNLTPVETIVNDPRAVCKSTSHMDADEPTWQQLVAGSPALAGLLMDVQRFRRKGHSARTRLNHFWGLREQLATAVPLPTMGVGFEARVLQCAPRRIAYGTLLAAAGFPQH